MLPNAQCGLVIIERAPATSLYHPPVRHWGCREVRCCQTVNAMTSKPEQLRSVTVVVADTGDIEAVRRPATRIQGQPSPATLRPLCAMFFDTQARDGQGWVSVRLRVHGFLYRRHGASFRNTGEIEALAGCDRLTIAPAPLDALAVGSEKSWRSSRALAFGHLADSCLLLVDHQLQLAYAAGPDQEPAAGRRGNSGPWIRVVSARPSFP
jgi:Transaldolase/Fructose-6-phosphate aldolase